MATEFPKCVVFTLGSVVTQLGRFVNLTDCFVKCSFLFSISLKSIKIDQETPELGYNANRVDVFGKVVQSSCITSTLLYISFCNQPTAHYLSTCISRESKAHFDLPGYALGQSR